MKFVNAKCTNCFGDLQLPEERDKTYYENKCNDIDKQIDSEVYKLYGLTEEEIKIIEAK